MVETTAHPEQSSSCTAADVQRWAHAVCTATTASPTELAEALGTTIGSAVKLGCQFICTPPAGLEHFEIVARLDDLETVTFIELMPSGTITVDQVAALLGEGREAMGGPHQPAPTVIFDDIRPDDAPRGCTVLAKLDPGWPQPKTIDTIVLYLQPNRLDD
jgi:hypothetical protein